MDEEEIRRLDDEVREAMLRSDVAALRRICSEDFVVTNPFNRVLDRQQVLEAEEAGRIKHSAYERQIESLRLHTDTAGVMGGETVVDDGQTKNRRYTEIWRRRGGRWQVIARHANHISS